MRQLNSYERHIRILAESKYRQCPKCKADNSKVAEQCFNCGKELR